MHRGKYERAVKKGRKYKRYTLLLISLFMLIVASIGGTIAYLQDSSAKVENTFTPAKVTIRIDETKQENIKYDIRVTNATIASKDAIPVYVRAKLVIYWTDVIDGKEQVIPKPAGDDYSVVVPAPVGTWFRVEDTYYYPSVEEPGSSTYAMVLQANPITVSIPDNLTVKCYIDVRAEAIQADPESVVGQVWTDVTVVDGQLSAKQEAGE